MGHGLRHVERFPDQARKGLEDDIRERMENIGGPSKPHLLDSSLVAKVSRSFALRLTTLVH
jgi:hypothetical protein